MFLFLKMSIMSIAKRVLIEELNDNIHPERVEDVIFWALEYYAKHKKENTFGKIVAASIIQNIKDQEDKVRSKSN